MIADQFQKTVSEVLDYVVDMTKWLAAGEAIAAVSANTSPSTLEIDSVFFTDKKATLRLVNGEAGRRYIVSVYLTISDGQVKLVTFGISVRPDSLVGTATRPVFFGFVDSTGPLAQDILDLSMVRRFTAQAIYAMSHDGAIPRYPCIVLPTIFGTPTFTIDGFVYGMIRVPITLLVDGLNLPFNIFVGDTPTFATDLSVTIS